MIDKNLSYYEVPYEINGAVQLIAIDIVLGLCKYRFVNVYRPPTRNTSASIDVKELLSCIKKLCSVRWPESILGDFNYPDINWSDFQLAM